MAASCIMLSALVGAICLGSVRAGSLDDTTILMQLDAKRSMSPLDGVDDGAHDMLSGVGELMSGAVDGIHSDTCNALSGPKELAFSFAKRRNSSGHDIESPELTGLVKKGNSSGHNSKLAVLLTGLANRLLVSEFLRNVVEAATHQGYAVEVYLSLVKANSSFVTFRNTSGLPFLTDPSIDGKEGEALIQSLGDLISQSGGKLVHGHFSEQQEALEKLPQIASRSTRMSQYSPYKSEIGRNVLRRYKSLEYLMAEVEREEPADWILELREDLAWMTPLNMSIVRDSAEPIAYGIDCLLWGGFNDKALIYNMEAGRRLKNRYRYFFDSNSTLLDDTKNAERYLAGVMKEEGVSMTLVPPTILGPASAMYREVNGSGSLEVCLRKAEQSICDNPTNIPPYCEPPKISMAKLPTTCSDIDIDS